MAVKAMKGNTTLTGATIGALANIRTISINTTQAVWDTTTNSTATDRTKIGTWADGSFTVTGIWDPAEETHDSLTTYAENATADTITIVFSTGESWAASCIMTDFTLDGDYEGGWTYSATFEKSGDATWTTAA